MHRSRMVPVVQNYRGVHSYVIPPLRKLFVKCASGIHLRSVLHYSFEPLRISFQHVCNNHFITSFRCKFINLTLCPNQLLWTVTNLQSLQTTDVTNDIVCYIVCTKNGFYSAFIWVFIIVSNVLLCMIFVIFIKLILMPLFIYHTCNH